MKFIIGVALLLQLFLIDYFLHYGSYFATSEERVTSVFFKDKSTNC